MTPNPCARLTYHLTSMPLAQAFDCCGGIKGLTDLSLGDNAGSLCSYLPSRLPSIPPKEGDLLPPPSPILSTSSPLPGKLPYCGPNHPQTGLMPQIPICHTTITPSLHKHKGSYTTIIQHPIKSWDKHSLLGLLCYSCLDTDTESTEAAEVAAPIWNCVPHTWMHPPLGCSHVAPQGHS